MDNSTLTHHGVRGMRWGVRRYQNKDGTLTPAGKKRYDSEMEKLKARERELKNRQRTQAKIDKLTAKRKELDEAEELMRGKEEKAAIKPDKSSKKSQKKSVKDMSTEELREVINRLELEKRYSDLSKSETSQKSGKGRKFVEDVVTSAGSNIAKQATAYVFGKGVNKIFREIFDEDIVDPKNIQKKK